MLARPLKHFRQRSIQEICTSSPQNTEFGPRKMNLLDDIDALRALFRADQRIDKFARVETFPRQGFSNAQKYIDRLMEMCSYEFRIQAAAALFDKAPENLMYIDIHEANILEASLQTSYYITKEDGAFFMNDIVVLVAQGSNIVESQRHIGFVSRVKYLPTQGKNLYTVTFRGCLKDIEKDQAPMWVIANQTSYLRVVDSLSNKKDTGSLPGLLLKPPILDVHSTDPVDIDPEIISNDLNVAQNQAGLRTIRSGHDDPIVLVQGPPGCGKSTTISTMIAKLVAQNRQVLSCAQTNVAVIDLAYKYMTSSDIRGEFDCLIDMKLSKITDKQKHATLARRSVEARFHGVVNAVLYAVRQIFHVQPIACFGYIKYDALRINSILRDSYLNCIRSRIFHLSPSTYTRTLFCAIRSAVDDPSSDLKSIKTLIIGMRAEISVFFRDDAFNDLLEKCRIQPEVNIQPFPIYSWVRTALLSKASVVFCTINVGISVTSKSLMSDLAYIIVDEAAQALEPDVVALMSTDDCFKRLVLVGDPKQLRGFCLSNRGSHEMFDRSLMERLQTYRLCEVTLLDTQFRMHPEIGSFVSRTFYDNRLISDTSVCNRQAKTPLAPISRIVFVGSQVEQSTVTPTSVVNLEEARNIVAHVFRVLLHEKRAAKPAPTVATTFSEALQSKSDQSEVEVAPDKKLSIGIICIYKAQANVVRCLVSEMLQRQPLPGVTIRINTIDSFQGSECDVIYVALTRTSKVNAFMGDPNRVNVAISRARENIIVVGDEGLDWTSDSKKSYWHSLCAGQNSMMIHPRLLQTVCAYNGPEKFKVLSAPSAATTTLVRSIISKSLLSGSRVWTVLYESVMIGPGLNDTHLLKYVVQSLANGALDVGPGGQTTRPYCNKGRHGKLFFNTSLGKATLLAWSIQIHKHQQALVILGIGTKAFIETTVWSAFSKSFRRFPAWEVSEAMRLNSSGTLIDLSKDITQPTLFFLPTHLEKPQQVAEKPLDHKRSEIMAIFRDKPVAILGDWVSMRFQKRSDDTENVIFTSLTALLKKLYFPASRPRVFVDRNVFRMDYLSAMPAMIRKLGADELYDSIQAHLDSPKSETKPPLKKVLQIYESVKTTRGHLDAHDLYSSVAKDPTLLAQMATMVSHIYLDEVQDITSSVWKIIEIMLSTKVPTVVCAGDFTQRLESGISLNNLKTRIYSHIPKNLELVKFRTNYRSDAEIVALANEIQRNTQMHDYAMEAKFRDSSQSITIVELDDMSVQAPEVLNRIGIPENCNASIVTSSSWTQPLKNIFGHTKNVFSESECKGLEFDLVVCWDLFNPSIRVKTSAIRRLAEGNLEEDNSMELYLNHLYVAVTRARKHLVIITPAEDRTHIMTKMLKLPTPIPFERLHPGLSHPIIVVLPDELSVSDDLRTAIMMRERGLLEQALNVFNHHNIRPQALFTQAQIYWKNFLEQEDAQDLQKAIVACDNAIEASQDRSIYSGLFEVDHAKKLLAQMLARDRKYCRACLVLEELGADCEDALIACLVDAIESKSEDLHDIRDIILPRSSKIWIQVGDNARFAGLVSILTASWGESMLGDLLADIPHRIALIAMHNAYASEHRKVFPVWDLLVDHVKTIDFPEWHQLRRLDDFADFGCILGCQKIYRHFALLLVFVCPGGSDNIDLLYQKIKSGALIESCKLSQVPILSVAVLMRTLSAPLKHFIAFSKQVTHSESRLGLLAEAYKIHRQEMCGSDLQLELFRWCVNMCDGDKVIETLCAVLLEDEVVLSGIFSTNNTITATQQALITALAGYRRKMP
ncbi:hypothetical protein BGW38_004837 [Lunasporangiospora selenospora]|uniref:AAA domain-containing protein n=1 Tax=Lunasporangiospora selenospora TaxID=979761 RepID=A0A9P6KH89_9FUNG|nr:hypothetical protein BGW38_004837 [Lunasporangiospora selenospora]